MIFAGQILDNDALGKKLITNPTAFVRDPNKRAMLTKPLHRMVSDVVIDVSQESHLARISITATSCETRNG